MIPNYGICKRNCSWYSRNMMTGISSRAHRCAASLEDDDASSAEHTQMLFLGVAI